jgi:hypothetical protein
MFFLFFLFFLVDSASDFWEHRIDINGGQKSLVCKAENESDLVKIPTLYKTEPEMEGWTHSGI